LWGRLPRCTLEVQGFENSIDEGRFKRLAGYVFEGNSEEAVGRIGVNGCSSGCGDGVVVVQEKFEGVSRSSAEA